MKFKLPTKSDLKSRASTISNAFAVSITPYIYPIQEEIDTLYRKLKISEGQCAYCLGKANAVDHVKPLVTHGLPTGYVTEIKNLVPCCSACNSAKGAKEFSEWYLSERNLARLHKEGLDEQEIAKRYEIILEYIANVSSPLNYREILGDELWQEYLIRRKELIQMLKDDQEFCDRLSNKIKKYFRLEKK